MRAALHFPTRHLPALLLVLLIPAAWAGESFPFPLTHPEPRGVRWKPLLQQSLLFVGIQHAFRMSAESDTRAGLPGPFFKGWMDSAANLHGWADGDPFFVNYIGHPMEGAVAGYVLVQNDPKYQRVQFGRNRDYWRSRLRAAAWAWAYSSQFEIGPISEASLGKIQAHFPQQGFVDHVITPSVGLCWMIGEDAVDKYLISRIEARTDKPIVRVLARGFLNPSRSFANILRGEVPWHRDTRPGVYDYHPKRQPDIEDGSEVTLESVYRNERQYAPFELAIQYTYMQLGAGDAGSLGCNGGGASALFNVTSKWGIEADVAGCKMVSPGRNVSGDATTYLVGPRYVFSSAGRWSPYVHFLAGGEKLTTETMNPRRKASMKTDVSKLESYSLHALYTSQSGLNTFAMQAGGGVDFTINRALAVRVADLEFFHTHAADFNGANLQNNIRFTTGVVLRMGTW